MRIKSLILLLFLLFFCSKEKPTKSDNSPPLVRIESPHNNQQVWESLYIKVVATDESSIKMIEIWGNYALLARSHTTPLEYTWDITRYTSGTELIIFATAEDENNNKGSSDTIKVIVTQPSTENINLFADSIGARSAKLRWNKYAGSEFYSYILAYSREQDVDTLDIIIARIYDQNETTRTVSGLEPSTTYFFRLFVKKRTNEIFGSNELRVETQSELVRDDGAEMVFVEGGSFVMGDSWGDGANDEIPVHTIYIPAFYIDKYEVTNRLFARFIEQGGYDNPEFWSYEGWQWKTRNNIRAPLYWNTGTYSSGVDYPDYPVVGVSYYEAEAYARFAGKEIPTEAMWEKAARGTSGANLIGNKWPWGNGFHQNINGTYVHCNYNGNDGFEDPFPELAPSGSFPTGASPYGALDMAGNVAEWTKDWYSGSYYQFSPSEDPQGPSSGTERVVRGGSWVNSSTLALQGYSFRTCARSKRDPADRKHYIGFRCARRVR